MFHAGSANGQRQSSARLSSYTTIITLAKVSVEYVEDYSSDIKVW